MSFVRQLSTYMNEVSDETLRERKCYIEMVLMNKLYFGLVFMNGLPAADKVDVEELIQWYQKALDFFIDKKFSRQEPTQEW